jgi:hypothetical protein
MNIIIGIIILATIAMIISGAFLATRLYHAKRRSKFVKDFTEYISVLQYHMEKSYDIIHKDRILVYSLDAVTLTDVEFTRASQDFVRLVIKFLGPMLFKEFVFLFGNEATFSFNVIEYFNTRYEDDEIRRSSLENIADQEGDTNREVF